MLLIILTVFLFSNAALYGVPVACVVGVAMLLNWKPRYRVAAAFAAIIVTAFVAPNWINARWQSDRAALHAEDIAATRLPAAIRHLAMLYDANSFEGGRDWLATGWLAVTTSTDILHRRFGLLLNGTVESLLVGVELGTSAVETRYPAHVAAYEPIKRYQIEKRAWCPYFWGGGYQPSLDELTRMAAGDCIIASDATLADADAIFAAEELPSRLSTFREQGGVQAWRFSLRQMVDGAWTAVYRETSVSGTELVAPLHIVVGGGLYMTSGMKHRSLEKSGVLDPDAAMAQLGFSRRIIPTPTEEERRVLVRRILDDAAIPNESVQSQFLAAYVMLGNWEGKDHDLVAAIVGDKRVDRFENNIFPKGPTPLLLARPLAERMLQTDLASPMSASALDVHRRVVRSMARLFLELPPCAALAARDLVEEAVRSPVRKDLVEEAWKKIERDASDSRCAMQMRTL